MFSNHIKKYQIKAYDSKNKEVINDPYPEGSKNGSEQRTFFGAVHKTFDMFFITF